MENKVVELNLNDVLPNRFQPRIKFSEASIQELANSIKDHGVIQPIVVRQIGDKYEIIAGERRYKASILAGKMTIPAIITNLSDKDSSEVALIENVQRKDLTAIEEAISYKKILDMGYLTQEGLATKLGKTQSTIANKLRLLNLDDDVQEALLNEKISERHARSLLRLPNHSQQRELLNRIVNERLTVRKTDEEIDKMINNSSDNEILNFNNIEQPIEQLNVSNQISEPEIFNPMPTSNQMVDELEVFNPSLESLNIPTSPIVDDVVPEVLPTNEVKQPEVFNPAPEVINATVPPVSEETFNSFMSEPEEFKIPDTVGIPSNPIEEPEITINENEFIKPNPGFMDINKIETEATDINVEKPLAPVENLLEPSQIPLEPIPNEFTQPIIPDSEDEEESAEDILVPGKFFNLMPEEDVSEKPIETNLDQPQPFAFDMDVSNLNNVDNTNNLPSLEEINVQIPSEQAINELPKTSENIIEPQTIEPQPILNPLNNYNSIHENPVPLAPETNNYMDTIAELELSNDALEPKEEPMPEMVLNNNTSFQVEGPSLKNAINMVRDLSEQLNKMGFIADTEEFDFEDMYQIVFKIRK